MNPVTALEITFAAPAVAVVVCLLCGRGAVAEWVNLLAAGVSFVAGVALPLVVPAQGATYFGGYILFDPLAAWVDLCVAVTYLLASIYAMGYLRRDESAASRPLFYALFAGFALTMFVAPVMNSLGLYWIAIELTTLVSTFLVGFERSRTSMEAAWKYVILVSAGISLALLGTVLLYWGGTFVLGPRFQPTWATLAAAAPHIPAHLLDLSFLLALVGYGTKVGLAPVHTWLPDAHGEAPTPVSAMLSGALLNTAMVGIVRFLHIARMGGQGFLASNALVALGIVSLLFAALLIVRQRGVKRLMAYSSVEHMGIIAIAFGFGGGPGIAAAFYLMLNHSLTKSLMFFGAGNAVQVFGTHRMDRMARVHARMPVSALLWLAGAVAITGAPPFGLFLGEFATLRAGWSGGNIVAVAVVALLLIVIFIGFINHFRGMYFDNEGDGNPPDTALSRWCVAPMWLALIPTLVLGLWWPHALTAFFTVAAHTLTMAHP